MVVLVPAVAQPSGLVTLLDTTANLSASNSGIAACAPLTSATMFSFTFTNGALAPYFLHELDLFATASGSSVAVLEMFVSLVLIPATVVTSISTMVAVDPVASASALQVGREGWRFLGACLPESESFFLSRRSLNANMRRSS